MGLLSTIGAASARAYGFTRSAIAAAVDAYFNRVTLLLPGNGTNGAQNNTFLDSSSNNLASLVTATRRRVRSRPSACKMVRGGIIFRVVAI